LADAMMLEVRSHMIHAWLSDSLGRLTELVKT
jgi:hypothetical protein